MAEKNLCCKTVTYYHIIPRAGSGNKRLSPWNMLQDFVHQFFSTALLPFVLTASQTGKAGGKMSWVILARTVTGFDQWEGGTDQSDQGEPANSSRPGHWPLPLSPPTRLQLCRATILVLYTPIFCWWILIRFQVQCFMVIGSGLIQIVYCKNYSAEKTWY